MSSIPSFVANGSPANGVGALTVSLPSGWKPNDLLVLFVESENQDISTPAGWTQISTAQGSGTAANDAAVRLEVFYKIATSSESSVSVADSGDHTSAFISAFSGVDLTTPIDVSSGDNATSATAITFPSVTTTVNNCLVINAIAGSQDTTTGQIGSWTNAGLSSLTERADVYTTQAGGGGISFATGEKATAGSTGSTTATAANATAQARLTFAIRPLLGLTFSNETFEGTPLTGVLPWTKYLIDGLTTSTVTSTTSHVTQGSNTWRIQGSTASDNTPAIATQYPYDLSSYSSISIDVYVASIIATDSILFLVSDRVSEWSVAIPSPTTGAVTLTINMSDAISAGIDVSKTYIAIAGLDAEAAGGGSIDYYVDNLVAAAAGNYTLTADAGSYTMSGTAASLERDLKLSADSGSYTLTGTNAGFIYNHKISADSGSYTISGTAAALEFGHVIGANGGSYVITGTDAGLSKSYPLIAGGGSYSISGTDADLQNDQLISAASGAYLLTGTAISLETDRLLSAEGGSYSITGTSTDLEHNFILNGESGSYSITGTNVNLVSDYLISVDAGIYNITGMDASLVAMLLDNVGGGEWIRRRRR